MTGNVFLSYDSFFSSFCNSSNLKFLQLSGCHTINDKDVHHILQKIAGTLLDLRLSSDCNIVSPTIQSNILERLDLKRCSKLKALTSIHCSRLQYLDLSFCTSLEDESLIEIITHCPNLTSLYLKGCKKLLQPCFTQCHHLRELDLSLCTMMQRIEILCPNLVSLEIGICVALKEANINLQSIEYLDLSMLPLQNFILTATKLKNLNLSGCYNLTDSGMKLHCPSLDTVDICGTNLNSNIFQEQHRNRNIFISEGGQPPLDWNELLDRS